MLNGNELAEFAIRKIGTPYFYGAKLEKLTEVLMQRMHTLYPSVVTNEYIEKARKQKQVNKINVDCSGLIQAYTGRCLGSAQLYAKANKKLPISEWRKFARGTVLWKNGHVGVYIGDGYLVEAKGITKGTVKSKLDTSKWVYGLTFSFMEYEYLEKVQGAYITSNPYIDDRRILKLESRGESVRWLQYELNLHGSNLKVDGIFGIHTKNALIQFQTSSKIIADGICGFETRKALNK